MSVNGSSQEESALDASENELRDAFRTATAKPSGACPDAEILASLIGSSADATSPKAPSDVIEHVAHCRNCADEVKVLFSLRDTLDAVVIAPAVPAPTGDPAPLRWLSAWARWRSQPSIAIPLMLMVLAAVLGVSYAVWSATQQSGIIDDRERSASAWTIATVPLDRANLDAAPARLEWTSTIPADSYRVTLYDAESIPIWESPSLDSTVVDLPESVRARLPVGSPVYWRVFALSGIDRRESSLHRFTIAPASGRIP